MQLWQKGVVLAKIESAYGTDPTPTGGDNAILAFNGNLDPNPQQPQERRPLRAFLGGARQPIAGRHVGLSFECELAGAGGAGDVPGYGPLLRACGLAQTVNASTNVEYEPVSASYESVTAFYNMDGVLHEANGVRGNAELRFSRDTVPMVAFSFLGLHVDPTAVTLPTADFSAFQHPLPVNLVNTPTLTIDSYAVKLNELSINLGNVVNYRSLVNSESIDIVDRVAVGRAVFEAPPIGTKNFFSVAKAETEVVLALVHGTTGGNKVQVDAPKIQLINPTYQNIDGVAHLAVDLVINPDSGNDEITLTVL